MFNDITPLQFYCHKILPLVYDDSLSYYEVLCKVQQKLNELIENNNELIKQWELYKNEINKAFDEYKKQLQAEIAKIKGDISTFEQMINAEIEAFKNTVNSKLAAQTKTINDFKTEVDNKVSEQDTKIQNFSDTMLRSEAQHNAEVQEILDGFEAKLNKAIADYNAAIEELPTLVNNQVNAWWQNEENYNKLVIDVANAIGTTLTSGAVTFSDVHTMMESTAVTLPAKSLAVCTNYYNTDGIYTLWVIVSGDVSDGVSRLALSPASDRTAILLSERNADTLGLRGISEHVGRSRLLTMCKNNYKYLKIVSNGTTLYIPNTADVGAASIMPLEIYGTNKEITASISFHGGDCNTVESISTLRSTFTGADTQFSSRCALENLEVNSAIAVTFQHLEWHDVWWRDNSSRDNPIVLAPTATDSRPQMKNSRFTLFGVRSYITLQNTVMNPKGIEIVGNSFYRTDGTAIGNTWAFVEINGNSSVVTLRDNFCYTGSETSASVIMVLANCKNFTETGKAIICEGNRNEVGGASHPMTMFTGDIPSDIVYVNNMIRFGNTYTLSDIPTTGSFDPARVMGETHPIGYLETSENQGIVHGTPLTLVYHTSRYWTADEVGYIALSSDRNAEYKVTVKGVIRVSGQASAGNVKVSLSGRATESHTISVTANLEYVPISIDFSYGTGGGFSVIVSSETANMTVIIREAKVLIERIR